jgi:hypothetical protein
MTTEKNLRAARDRHKIIPQNPVTGKPGRNMELVTERNTCMMYRYFYYCYHKRMLYNEAIDQLSREYYITEYTIKTLIQENLDMVSEIRNIPDVLVYCKDKWKHMVWE